MAAYVKYHNFVAHLAHGAHDFSTDTLSLALSNAANAPSVSADAVLADIVEISYTNLGARTLTVSTEGQTTGTYSLTLNDKTLSATGTVAGFRYISVYNTTASGVTNPLICYFDYGSDLVLNNGESLTIDFESNAGTTGKLFTIA